MKRKTLLQIGLITLLVTSLVVAYKYKLSSDNQHVDIGVLSFLTGTFADLGNDLTNGSILAADELNENRVKKIKLHIADGKAEAKTAVSAMQQLTMSKLDGMIVQGDNQVPPVAPFLVKKHMPSIATCLANSSFLKANKEDVWIFRNFASTSLCSAELGAYARSKLNAVSSAVLYMQSEYGEESVKAFREKFVALGGKVVSEQTFLETGSDMRGSISKILKTNPDVIFVAGYGNGYYVVMNQVREAGYNGFILTGDSISNPESIKNIKNVDKIIFANQIIPESNEYKHFSQSYKSRFNREPNIYAAYGYDSLRMLIHAIDDGDGNPIKVRDNLLKIRNRQTLLGTITFTKDGDCIVPISLNRLFADGHTERCQ